ncbi:hypothetical protein BDZ85DRAFT_262855 [Elsinoe ampelina]|uniref:Methyltransferase domain-containing protein n=1 Tax=Elsinoe ampelina TaxID=302913 RepID=A0A6A6GBD4_9PEZI|nr:hypothetical protein BDZ85DRAFT_262855 [Elsinoe ampelina]
MAVESGTASFPNGFIYPYHVWDYLRPTFYCPMDLERVRRLGDGGKWVCGMSRYEDIFPPSPAGADHQGAQAKRQSNETKRIIYSFGVSDDSSFEAALLHRTNADIWG